MDTYFNVDSFECTDCGKCIQVCPRNFIYRAEYCDEDFDETFIFYEGVHDNPQCHHCDGFWENKTPCQEVCEANAIKITRW